MLPGAVLEGVKNTVGTGEIEILGLETAWLTAEPLGVLITGDGLPVTGGDGGAFWQLTRILTRLKNTPNLKMWNIKIKSRIDLVE